MNGNTWAGGVVLILVGVAIIGRLFKKTLIPDVRRVAKGATG